MIYVSPDTLTDLGARRRVHYHVHKWIASTKRHCLQHQLENEKKVSIWDIFRRTGDGSKGDAETFLTPLSGLCTGTSSRSHRCRMATI